VLLLPPEAVLRLLFCCSMRIWIYAFVYIYMYLKEKLILDSIWDLASDIFVFNNVYLIRFHS